MLSKSLQNSYECNSKVKALESKIPNPKKQA